MKKQLFFKFIPLIAGALLVAVFYIAIPSRAVMDTAKTVSGYVRYALGQMTSLIPFSVYELAVTLLILLVLFHLIRSAAAIVRAKGERVITAVLQMLPLAAAGVIIWAAFLWLWCSLYYTTPFYEGVLKNTTPSEDDLKLALEVFIDGANASAPFISRDSDGHINESVPALLKRASDVIPYGRLSDVFPRLERYISPRPKSMLYSEIMSRTHFTGIYFALTGEANLNSGTPLAYLPSDTSHELAHAHGIAAESEANFAGILAAILSDDPAFRYSGYLLGVTELGNALYETNPDAYVELAQRYSDLILLDFRDNSEYWENYEDTPAAVTVSVVYDGYLKSNGQSLGIRSYGACVNLLSEWVNSGRMRV
ncbi:MAG: DUF3810 domain-containing protein [Oscillospiraceae bacterium]|jgi:hypothetical protein|nr:DUF3810 domain-containing protein [Oscillospiraceae bacterium]